MPCASSTFGSVAQSFQVTQCVRFVTGAGTLGNLAAKPASCVEKIVCAPSNVHDPHPLLIATCRASSKPASEYAFACASVIGMFEYTYDVERTHSQSTTEQSGGLAAAYWSN